MDDLTAMKEVVRQEGVVILCRCLILHDHHDEETEGCCIGAGCLWPQLCPRCHKRTDWTAKDRPRACSECRASESEAKGET